MVNFQPYDATASNPAYTDPFALIEGGGKRSVSFAVRDQFGNSTSAPLGTFYEGLLAEDLATRQQTNFDSGAPEFWDNGQPKLNVVGNIQTDLREDENDDGIRSIWFRGQMLQALQQEVREKKAGKFGPGTRIRIELVDFKAIPGKFPQKIYKVTLGPEIVPWVPEEQRRVADVLAAPQGQPTQQGGQQWYVAPQGGVAQAPVAQPPVAQAPVAQAPVAQAPVAQAPVAAMPASATPVILQEHIDGVLQVIGVGVPRDVAITSVASKVAPGDDAYMAALQAAIPAA